MELLFINSLKGLKKKKVQMLGIIVMVLLSAGIYTAMNSALDRLEDRYYHYLDEQKVEDFSFEPVIDYTKDITIDQLNQLKVTHLANITPEENQLLDLYQKCITTEPGFCTDTTYMQIKYLFTKYSAIEEIVKPKLDALAIKYNLTYQMEYSKIISEEKYMVKAIPYNSDKSINIPYLIEGRFPEKDNEITVLPKFAQQNNLTIGDTYEIGNYKYIIVGYAYSSDHIYPMISFNVPIFDEKYNNIIFMNQTTYDKINGLTDNNFIARFNYTAPRKNRITMNISAGEERKEKSESTIAKIFDEEKDTIAMGMSSIVRVMRTDYLQMEFASNRQFAEYFLYLLLGISVFIILVITKKRIDDERLQIGVLKSLGYNSFSIATSYLVYPIIGSIIGGTIGYLIGSSLNGIITNLFLNYFNVPLSGFHFDLSYLVTSIIVPMIMLSILSYLISILMLKKKPLDLLKEGSNLKVNLFSKIINKITSPLSFDYRFKYSLASRSLGKLFIVSLTSFCTGMLIVLILIGMNLFNSLIDSTFEGMSYKYMISYTTPQTKEDKESDLVLEHNTPLIELQDEKGNKKSIDLEEDEQITITGIDTTSKYLKLLDKNEKNIINKLDNEENTIINGNIAEVIKAKVGDKLIFTINNQSVSYNIVGITEQYMGNIIYVNREDLSTKIGYKEPIYSKKYSSNHRYSTIANLDSSEVQNIGGIFSIEDLERNIRKQMQTVNTSIYIIIFFASFMALIIIAVIANIVVEENKKTISLMKVMGYKNKKISRIVLNIYTPFVILSYLLSIPIMITLLKWIVSLLVGDMNMAIPISLSPVMALIGLLGLVLAYYIAISLSKNVLNKVPLAVALKRE